MLSPGSLAAFSSSVPPLGSGMPSPVQRARSMDQTAQPAVPATPTAPLQIDEIGRTPGRILPRGSLLDLSV
jgi:hypothetical protein